MDSFLPAFVDQLLQQGRDPGEIPRISSSAATGWLAPLATRILNAQDTDTHKPTDAFLAHGYAYLPLPALDNRALYLRAAAQSVMTPWPVNAPSVILTLAGTVALEVYQEASDMRAGRPQYARSFSAEQVFTLHPGTLCATQSSNDGLQMLATTSPQANTSEQLTGDEYAAVARRARWTLESLSGAVNGRC